jgi:hypothetical protein
MELRKHAVLLLGGVVIRPDVEGRYRFELRQRVGNLHRIQWRASMFFNAEIVSQLGLK